ncbi:glycosyltransferase family 4 protein [Aequorivita sp. F47161]|uniref:Glycosyltransferase family 4 protein n=1 Tax=Aequorivita vitellina TaxID=2874475 RepID=A0A9X1QUK0_9FLAO|nr:glycosyltransferase family 4 protein [Aequorivita vitellina]MCG2419771.1 glycosyltransferase family 4 protein [Aequorivita vitellina]
MFKLVRVTTVPVSLNVLLNGQLRFMNKFYKVLAVSSGPEEELIEVEKREGVPAIQVEMTRAITPIQDLKAVWQLYKLFKKEKPTLVHTHTPKAGTLGMLAAKLAGVPHRLHTVAGLPLLEAIGLKRSLLDIVEKITYRCATRIYPNSKGLYDIILAQGYCKLNKIQVIANGSSNGVDTSHFSPDQINNDQKKALRKELDLNDDDFVFIFIGRLVGDKGINELVSAFSSHRECRAVTSSTTYHSPLPTHKLLLIGSLEAHLDPLEPETLQEIESNPKILTVGFQKDVRPYLAISHALAFPSYREGFPNVVMQAGAMGLPSIVTDINGCNEIIIPNINGLIIPPKNSEALADAMQLLMDDTDLYQQLKSNAREKITSRFERQQVWDALLAEYQDLLKESGLSTSQS